MPTWAASPASGAAAAAAQPAEAAAEAGSVALVEAPGSDKNQKSC